MRTTNENLLPEQTDIERLKAYKLVTQACVHLFSKNKPQVDKIKTVLRDFYPLAKNDPLFMAKLAAWSADEKHSQSRDLQLVAMYLNALNDADGTPFVVGGTVRKPNLRIVTHALLSSMNPKELFRLAYMRRIKWNPNGGADSQHFPNSLKTAIRSYLESLSVKTLQKHVERGFTRHLQGTFRLVHGQPSASQAKVLHWQQQTKRGLEVELEAAKNPFDKLSASKIAEKIVEEKIPFRRALSWLDSEPPIQILEALLEVGSPNELLVQTSLFDKGGLLAIPELAEKFYAKLEKASSADRLDTIKFETTEGVKEKLAESRAKSRQVQFGQLPGKLHLAVDKSGSQDRTIDTAKQYASTFAEVVGSDNFSMSLFDTNYYPVVIDGMVTKEKVIAALYLYRGQGGTDCFVGYKAQMSLDPPDWFVWFTDGGHGQGSTNLSGLNKPKACLIIRIPSERYGYSIALEDALRKNDIPFAVYEPEFLKSSNLVVQALKAVVKGETAIISEIMEYPLPVKIEGVN